MNQKASQHKSVVLQDLRGADETRLVDRQPYVQFDQQQGLQQLQIGHIERTCGKKFHQLFDGPVLGIGQIFTPVGIVPIYYQTPGNLIWEEEPFPPWNIPPFPWGPPITLPGGTNLPYYFAPPHGLPSLPQTGFPGGEQWEPSHKSASTYYDIEQFIEGDVETSDVTVGESGDKHIAGTALPFLVQPAGIVFDWVVAAGTFLFHSYVESSSQWLLQIKFDRSTSDWHYQNAATSSTNRFAINLTSIADPNAKFYTVHRRVYYKSKTLGFISYYPQFPSWDIEYVEKQFEQQIHPDEDGIVHLSLPLPTFGGVLQGASGTASRYDQFGYEEVKGIRRIIREARDEPT